MAMEGTLKNRNGKLYVLYTSDEYSEPFRQFIWYRVLETRGSGYGERPEAEDIATSTGGGEWRTRNPSTHRSTGSVSVGTGSTQAELVERVSINPPPAGGKELRWRDGRWEKLMAKGWMPAGEGKASSKKSSAKHSTISHATKKKSPTQLDREIAESLAAARAAMAKARSSTDPKDRFAVPVDPGGPFSIYVKRQGEDTWRRVLGPFATKKAAEKESKNFRARGKRVAVMPTDVIKEVW